MQQLETLTSKCIFWLKRTFQIKHNFNSGKVCGGIILFYLFYTSIHPYITIDFQKMFLDLVLGQQDPVSHVTWMQTEKDEKRHA